MPHRRREATVGRTAHHELSNGLNLLQSLPRTEEDGRLAVSDARKAEQPDLLLLQCWRRETVQATNTHTRDDREDPMSTDAPVRPTARPLGDVLGYEHGRLLERFVTDHGGDIEDAVGRFLALKQFLAVCAIKPGVKATSSEIDDMWHTFLLFTGPYREFCQMYLGRFIDHEPFEAAQPDYYDVTRAFACELFGTLDERYWPVQGKADCSSGCGD